MSIIGATLKDASQLIERQNDFGRREILIKPLFPGILTLSKEDLVSHPKLGPFIAEKNIDVATVDIWNAFAVVRAKLPSVEGPLRFAVRDGVAKFEARYEIEVEKNRRKEKTSTWSSVLHGLEIRDAAKLFPQYMFEWLEAGLPQVFDHITRTGASVPAEQYVFEYDNIFKLAFSADGFKCDVFGDHTDVDSMEPMDRKRTLLMALAPSTRRTIPLQTVIMMVDVGADTAMVTSALKNQTLLSKVFGVKDGKRNVKALRGYGSTGTYMLQRPNDSQDGEIVDFVE